MSYLYVVKRDGSRQSVEFDKITRRISSLCNDINIDGDPLHIDAASIAQKVCARIYTGVTTTELDELASQICTSLQTEHPHYRKLSSRIVISNHHKNTSSCYLTVAKELVSHKLITNTLFTYIEKHLVEIQSAFNYTRDFKIEYFGFKTLERSYLLRIQNKVIERPQHLWMRVALGLYTTNIKAALACYHELSTHSYTHATPTLFNCGTPKNQLASCFLLTMKDDSIDGIFDTLKNCALISKYAGGIGLSVHNIRSTGSYICGTNGTSNGLVPMLRVFNDTARYVDQGGGKRNGSFAIYIEPWHADIIDFLHLKRNHGTESSRARDLFYALWTPDLFMKRVKQGGNWTLFDPNKVPELSNVYGKEFDIMYEQYEKDGKGNETISAQKLWNVILDSMIETGTPYMLFKDSCNAKSNQKNLGTIKSSNLCTEIIEYSSEEEIAVCNLASINLSSLLIVPSLDQIDIELHSKEDCVFCKIALAHMKRLGGNVKIVTYTADEKQKYIEKFPTRTTFPTILFDGKVVGGYTELIMCTRSSFDFTKLEIVTRSLVRNLNRTIDITFYPTPETRTSNLRRRPIGIGVQGLADVFFQMHYAFDGNDARILNRQIFATIYYSALSESVQLSKQREKNVQYLKDLHVKWCNDNSLPSTPSLHLENMFEKGNTDHDFEKDQILYSSLYETINCAPDVVHRDTQLYTGLYPGAYDGFESSPLAEGKFQFDLWDKEGGDDRYDWNELHKLIKQYGIRNSLLIAPMPTASTAQILGNIECFEPITSNLYLRRTLAGEFIIVNQYMHQDLIDMGLWNSELKDEVLFHEGSIQTITSIPQYFRNIYKTVWDISQKVIIDMAADRGRYICQSQSMNLFLADTKTDKITSMLFYAWKKGLKTGMYYLRTKPSSKAQQFTLDPAKYNSSYKKIEEDEICLNCSA